MAHPRTKIGEEPPPDPLMKGTSHMGYFEAHCQYVEHELLYLSFENILHVHQLNLCHSSRYPKNSFRYSYIDSLDGFTFRNQLISILLVLPTRQHLHAIFSFLACP